MKIGLVGVGHLGKIHLKCLLNTKFQIAGFYEPDHKTKAEIVQNYDIRGFDTLDELIANSDCVDIVSPTSHHYSIAKKAISLGRSVFIEKPLTETIEQAEELVKLAKAKGVKVQVGHVERYNPAIRSLQGIELHPGFIEAHRLALFNPRGTDVSVVLDLMIHDIDIILSLVKAEIIDIRANGICVVSTTPDICNARIEFEDGTVANLTASRISLKNMRKIRLFQPEAYISLDFLKKDAQIIRINDNEGNTNENVMSISTSTGIKHISVESPSIMQNNAIEDELNDFYEALVHDQPVSVTIEDGLKALKLAQQIEDKIRLKNEKT